MNLIQNIYFKVFGDTDESTLLISLFAAVVIFFISKAIGSYLSRKADFVATKIVRLKDENIREAISESLEKPVRMWVEVTGIFIAVMILPFGIETGIVIDKFALTVYRLAMVVVGGMLADNLLDSIPHFSRKFAESPNQTLLTFLLKIGKVLIWIVVVAVLLNEIGFDVTGVVAGLGLGGIILALAAQDTASNLFAGMVILFDKPFAIGDWISVGGMEGIVEKISFRSCRIRTFDNALIAVPNSKLGSDSVTNWTKMEQRKTRFVIGLVYSTSKETLQKVCDEIVAMLSSYDSINKDTIMVYFDSFNSSSLDVVVQYHTYLTGGGDFLNLKQEVQYKVMDIVEANGTDFAYNTQTIIVEKGE